MAKIKIDKVLSSLPVTLVANTVYFLRVGSGIELHVTDSTGTVAHVLNLATTSTNGLMSGGDKTKLDGISTSANNYSHPNHTGDITSTGDGATVIAANAVTNAKMATMPTKTYKGNTTGGTAAPTDVTVATMKVDLALNNVDNTSDATKPVSTAQQTALNLKANIASPTFTGTVAGITKAMVGLPNVDDTSDATKNSATATLTNKTLASPIITTGLELGHATDTTITRSSAGVIAVEGVVIPTISSGHILTNKRITKRVSTEASSATPSINTDGVDIYKITALAVNITSMSTNLSGTPTDGQTLIIQITGTAARTITWGTSFESSTVTLPATTVTTARLDVGFLWNAETSKWRCVAVA